MCRPDCDLLYANVGLLNNQCSLDCICIHIECFFPLNSFFCVFTSVFTGSLGMYIELTSIAVCLSVCVGIE